MATKKYLPEHLIDLTTKTQNKDEVKEYLNFIAEVISFGRSKVELVNNVNMCYEYVWKKSSSYNDKLYPGVRVKFTLDSLDSVFYKPYSEHFKIPNGEYYGWIDNVMSIGDVVYNIMFVYGSKVYEITTHKPELLEIAKELSVRELRKMLKDLEKTTE